MGKASQQKIDLVFKTKRDDDMIGFEEDPSPMADQPLPMLEIEQPHPESQDEVNIEGELLEKYSYEDIIEDFKCVKERNADL
ncbi:hypothetical protein CFC21_085984 [Triticum aestivum]|uniref:Uncharacterized protein n=3 Tax=Triticum TaxID=4564 RepID=A0A9R1L979_WHEAT|nr:hypothetical protein CFC21_066858 [Triticum aestivum]KAF7082104.1 hypothetical protein CFC21_085984 [Triticum aestivum]VAI52780.1 unnamed protein product [Triticum turgidum subsp. durum]